MGVGSFGGGFNATMHSIGGRVSRGGVSARGNSEGNVDNFLLALLSGFLCCLVMAYLIHTALQKPSLIKKEIVYVGVHITEVRKAKYSKIEGFVVYQGIKFYIDNGQQGYHYKEYNLSRNDVVTLPLTFVYYSSTDDNSVNIRPLDPDFNKYITN